MGSVDPKTIFHSIFSLRRKVQLKHIYSVLTLMSCLPAELPVISDCKYLNIEKSQVESNLHCSLIQHILANY